MRDTPLDERQATVLLLRARGLTFSEIGKVHGVGRERSRQILKTACEALGAADAVHALAIALRAGIFDMSDLAEVEVPESVLRTRASSAGAASDSVPL